MIECKKKKTVDAVSAVCAISAVVSQKRNFTNFAVQYMHS